ncbi:MAG: hypothetical protein PHF29_06635 [Candidatus Riflebacteria bacterium]|nr:hypothetical protein [Candidatus Riflebacteria bacterium]
MFEKKCDQCSAKIEIPDNYSAPFVQCPGCGSHQRYQKPKDLNEPEYKLGSAKVSAEALRIPGKVLDDSKIFEDAVGKAGLDEVYKQVAIYMSEKNIAKRRTIKSKSIQTFMRKFKISADMTSHMLDYAEKAPETQEITVALHRKKIIIAGVVSALCVALLIGLMLAFV